MSYYGKRRKNDDDYEIAEPTKFSDPMNVELITMHAFSLILYIVSGGIGYSLIPNNGNMPSVKTANVVFAKNNAEKFIESVSGKLEFHLNPVTVMTSAMFISAFFELYYIMFLVFVNVPVRKWGAHTMRYADFATTQTLFGLALFVYIGQTTSAFFAFFTLTLLLFNGGNLISELVVRELRRERLGRYASAVVHMQNLAVVFTLAATLISFSGKAENLNMITKQANIAYAVSLVVFYTLPILNTLSMFKTYEKYDKLNFSFSFIFKLTVFWIFVIGSRQQLENADFIEKSTTNYRTMYAIASIVPAALGVPYAIFSQF